MPELPEVETIRRQLSVKLRGKKWQGQRIAGVRRRAKLLLIDFEDGSSLVFHLKLTGQLLFNGPVSPCARHVFEFDDGTYLVFNDMRKFGWWKRMADSRKIEEGFGREALKLTLPELKVLLKERSKTRIKPLLMDQKAIAGIGNIYSDEILFDAAVRPDRRTGTITEKEAEDILTSAKKILKKAIEKRGSSVEHYLDALGEKGGYEPFHRVYRKKECAKCGSLIKKVKIGGRSAHFCASCQR